MNPYYVGGGAVVVGGGGIWAWLTHLHFTILSPLIGL
jgi:hypothetical protein